MRSIRDRLTAIVAKRDGAGYRYRCRLTNRRYGPSPRGPEAECDVDDRRWADVKSLRSHIDRLIARFEEYNHRCEPAVSDGVGDRETLLMRDNQRSLKVGRRTTRSLLLPESPAPLSPR